MEGGLASRLAGRGPDGSFSEGEVFRVLRGFERFARCPRLVPDTYGSEVFVEPLSRNVNVSASIFFMSFGWFHGTCTHRLYAFDSFRHQIGSFPLFSFRCHVSFGAVCRCHRKDPKERHPRRNHQVPKGTADSTQQALIKRTE